MISMIIDAYEAEKKAALHGYPAVLDPYLREASEARKELAELEADRDKYLEALKECQGENIELKERLIKLGSEAEK